RRSRSVSPRSPRSRARWAAPSRRRGPARRSVREEEARRAKDRPAVRARHGSGDARHRARPAAGGRRRNRVQAAVVRRVPQCVRRRRPARRGRGEPVRLADRAEERRVRVRLDHRARSRAGGSRRERAHAVFRADRERIRLAAAGGDLPVRRLRASRLLHLRLQARRLVAVHPRRQSSTRQRDGARAEGEARTLAAERAGPDAMARALRRTGMTPAAAALVAVSTVAYAVAGRHVPGLWIMPDEAIYADRAFRLWNHGSLPVFRGQGAGYGLLYPVL